MSWNEIRIRHPQLGNVVGRDGDVASFRGIPYGALMDRLSEPQIFGQYTDPLDATDFGPVSPHPIGAFQLEMTLMQQSLTEPLTLKSDLDALNLNIWVPKIDGKLPKENSLPVFVWLHGGGFVSGASSWPQYDLARLVKLSADNKTPIIGVSINFRLGLPGYLTSAELRSAGYKPNNQLRDQRVAFSWLHKHISGFGGAADEITVAGESTGAVNLGLHLQSEEPLFARALMTGGSSLLMPASDAEYQEWVYEKAVGALGLENKPPSERIDSLLTISSEEIISKLSPPLPYRPMVDDGLVTFSPTYSMVADPSSTKIPGKQWLKGLMVGDCQFDASSMAIFMAHVKPGISQRFPDHLRKTLGKENPEVEELLEAYGFTTNSTDDETAFKAWLAFVNDICYHAATVSFARGWNENCYLFFMNERNPWSGMFQGEATHIMDVILLFQNFNDDLPTAMKEAAKGFANDVFKFMYGESPWPRCSGIEQAAKVFGPSSWDPHMNEPSSTIVRDLSSDNTGRRSTMTEIGRRIGHDRLALAFASFVAQ